MGNQRASSSRRRGLPDLRCSECGRAAPATGWRCGCSGILDIEAQGVFDPEALASRPNTLWRYREALPPVSDESMVSLGEGWTPLVPSRASRNVLYKLDFLFPSGSFKDRGSAVLASCAREMGIAHVVEDSSGNAGASMAAYFAAAGIPCTIFAPSSASAAKLTQIGSHGAKLVLVEGSRSDVTRAAEAAADGSYYGSHQLSPYFLAGTQTFAFEVWEQLGRRAPGCIVVPVGSGTLLLGAYLGFRHLLRAGLIDRLPRIVGAQAESCAPLYHAMRQGLDSVDGVECPLGESVAEGIRVQRPPRARQILHAVRETGGEIVAVSEPDIAHSWRCLAEQGLFVEPTAAVAPAAASQLAREGLIGEGKLAVVALSGSGLKGVERIASPAPQP